MKSSDINKQQPGPNDKVASRQRPLPARSTRASKWLRWSIAASLGLSLTAACSRQVVSTSTSLPGAQVTPQVSNADASTPGSTSGRAAIDAFLKAVNAQDLQAMSGQWGNQKGLARDQFKREELEKRLIVMQCLMQHDKYRYPEDRPRLVTGGRQEYLVELTRGNIVAQTTFTTITGPQGRWLVEDVDVTKLRDFCR